MTISQNSRAPERTPRTGAPPTRLIWRAAGALLLATALVATAVAATRGPAEAQASPAAASARSAAAQRQLGLMTEAAFDKATDERDQRIQREQRLENEALWQKAVKAEAKRQEELTVWNTAVMAEAKRQNELAAWNVAVAEAERAQAFSEAAARNAAEERVANERSSEQRAVEAQRSQPATSSSGSGSGVWNTIAQCESGGNWATNTGNGYYGGLQFSLSTWQAHGGVGMPHEQSASAQIAVAERVKASQGWGAWPACSSKAGLR